MYCLPRLKFRYPTHPAITLAVFSAAFLLSCSPQQQDAGPQRPPVQDLPYKVSDSGDPDPIANPSAVKGGSFHTWAGGYPKSLNMWLDYNSF
jgi:hypothetical protein